MWSISLFEYFVIVGILTSANTQLYGILCMTSRWINCFEIVSHKIVITNVVSVLCNYPTYYILFTLSLFLYFTYNNKNNFAHLIHIGPSKLHRMCNSYQTLKVSAENAFVGKSFFFVCVCLCKQCANLQYAYCFISNVESTDDKLALRGGDETKKIQK